MLYPLLLSGTDSWRADRLFLLRLLRFPPLTDGDLAALRKRHIPSLLLSNLDSFTADAPLRAAAIQALAAIADTRQGAVYLVQHASALSSLRILAATLSASPFCTPFTRSSVGGTRRLLFQARQWRPAWTPLARLWLGRPNPSPAPTSHSKAERARGRFLGQAASGDCRCRGATRAHPVATSHRQSRGPLLSTQHFRSSTCRKPSSDLSHCHSRSISFLSFDCATPLAWKGDMTVALAADWSRARAGARAKTIQRSSARGCTGGGYDST